MRDYEEHQRVESRRKTRAVMEEGLKLAELKMSARKNHVKMMDLRQREVF